MTSPLLHRPIPFKDESPGSYLLRAAEYNGWQPLSSLLIAHMYSYSKNSTINIESIMCDQNKWDEILGSFGITDNLAKSIGYKKLGPSNRSNIALLGVLIQRRKLRLKKPAICPICLAKNKYHKSIWDFKLITTCSEHKVKLIDSCPSCKGEIAWNRKKLSQCKCKHKLSKSITEQCNTDVTVYVEQLIQAKEISKLDILLSFHSIYEEFYCSIGIASTDHDLATLCMHSLETPNKAIDIIQQDLIARPEIHPRLGLHPLLSSSDPSIQSIAKRCLEKHQYKQPLSNRSFQLVGKLGLTTVSHVLGVSPFFVKALVREKILNQCLDKTKKKYHPLFISLDSLNVLLHLCSKGSANQSSTHQLKSIKDFSHTYQYSHMFIDLMVNIVTGKKMYAGDQVLEDGLKGIHIEPVKQRGPEVDKSMVTIKDVAQLCGVHYENIRFAVHAGFLKRVPANKTKGTSILIHKEDADEFNKRYIFSGCIAKQHGCTPTNLAEKISSAGVKPISGPSIDGGLVYLFKRTDINSLDMAAVSKIRNYPTRTGRRKSGKNNEFTDNFSLSVSKVSEIFNINPQKVSSLIKGGYLLEHPTLSREKRVKIESVNRIHNINIDSSLIPVSTASKSIHESEQQFRMRWLQTNFIEFIDTGLKIFIRKNDLQKIRKFKSKFIIAREASVLTGSNTSSIRFLKRNNTIKSLKQLGEGNKKVIFYDKKEILSIYSYRM